MRLGCNAVFLAVSEQASSQSEDTYYEGKAVFIVIGLALGGGCGAYSNSRASNMSQHFACEPNVLAQNVPSGLKAVRPFDAEASEDS